MSFELPPAALWICLFWTVYVSGILQQVAFVSASLTQHHVFKVTLCCQGFVPF